MKQVFITSGTILLILTIVGAVGLATPVVGNATNASDNPEVNAFLALLDATPSEAQASLKHINDHWHPGFTAMTLEIIYFANQPSISDPLLKIIQRHTGQTFGHDLNAWYQWLWNQPENPHAHYAQFKSLLYRRIDPVFARYFDDDRPREIRLDEIRWGGVKQDGIPPLRQPEMISAAEATYLEDSNVVFGLEVGGDARAYPKRILAWHEMFVDRVGEVSLAGVYCTLCGTVIVYETTVNGTHYELGTSGFLYRSNKLMYDRTTQSLWNTIWGTPAVGPLVGKDIELPSHSVVTTTWGAWKERHPDTKVLSLNTGHRRDYAEGAAYRQYFATDDLMFITPQQDDRLKNKADVLALRLPQAADRPLAIASDFLREHPVYHHTHAGVSFVVLTDKSGAHRVYETKDVQFRQWDQVATVTDEQGQRWQLTEDQLATKSGETLARLPSHNAFWFGWYAAYPQTELIQ